MDFDLYRANNSINEYPGECNEDNANNNNDNNNNNWMTHSFDVWASNASCSDISNHSSSSPAAPSFSSDCFSSTSKTVSFDMTRRSSDVSVTASSWSDDFVSSPATPSKREVARTMMLLHTDVKACAYPYDLSDEFMSPFVAEDDSNNAMWHATNWNIPHLALGQGQGQGRQGPCMDTAFTNRALHTNEHVLPLAPHATNPVLSQQIFPNPVYTTPVSTDTSEVDHTAWPSAAVCCAPRTIAPKAIVQTLLSSSPVIKSEMSSPLRTQTFTHPDTVFDSSPMPAPSPRVLFPPRNPSNHMSERSKGATSPAAAVAAHKACGSRGSSTRRPMSRKMTTSISCRPIRATEKIVCDTVIPRNTFACTFPGCVDKDTGLPKCFKRQEHRKRHELTVHKPVRKHYCWVPGCLTGFTRTDNLKNHIITTHGKNNSAQRNRYVATLDPSSEFYDPKWEGELTEDGFPLVEGVATHPCPVPACHRMYHIEDKMKTHVLQHHGRNIMSANTNTNTNTTIDTDIDVDVDSSYLASSSSSSFSSASSSGDNEEDNIKPMVSGRTAKMKGGHSFRER